MWSLRLTLLQLRTRCQYYSTLGDREDESATGDQHIMSAEGRPIATITPGVSIYVTAILEFVGEYILQHIAEIIERDNSDEASLADLKAAIEEDEWMITLWRQMMTKQELEKRLAADAAFAGAVRTSRPWQVPQGSELEEAADMRGRFNRSVNGNRQQQAPSTATEATAPFWSQGERSDSDGHGRSASDTHDFLTSRDSRATSGNTSFQASSATAPTNDSSNAPKLSRRSSVEKGFVGLFAGRRRNSFKGGQESRPTSLVPPMSPAGEPESTDDFESLMMSEKTMKVSLTPNRLRTIEVARQEAEAAKKAARQRPGTLNIANLRREVAATTPSNGSDTRRTSISSPISGSVDGSRPGSALRNGFPRKPRASQPPTSYRGLDMGESSSQRGSMSHSEDTDADRRMSPDSGYPSYSMPYTTISTAATDQAARTFSTPPPPALTDTRKSSVGGKMRALLGRRSTGDNDSLPGGPRSDSRQSTTPSVAADSQIASDTHEYSQQSALDASAQSRMMHSGLSRDRSPTPNSSNDHNLFGPSERLSPTTMLQDRASLLQSQQRSLTSSNETQDIAEDRAAEEGSTAAAPIAPSKGPTTPIIVRSSYDGFPNAPNEEMPRSPGAASHLSESRPDGPPSRKIPIGRRASREGTGPGALSRRRSSLGPAVSQETPYDGPSRPTIHRGSLEPMAAEQGLAITTAPTLYLPNERVASSGQTHPEDVAASTTAHVMDSKAVHSSTIDVLRNLAAGMETCHSAHECRTLVTEALGAAQVVADTGGTIAVTRPSIANELPRVHRVPVDGQGAMSHAQINDSFKPGMPVLVMADDYDEEADEHSAAHQRNGLIAAWLLDGAVPPQTDAFPTISYEGDRSIPLSSPAISFDGAVSPKTNGARESAYFVTPSSSLVNVDSTDVEGSMRPSGLFDKKWTRLSTATADDMADYTSADEGDIEENDESISEFRDSTTERSGTPERDVISTTSTPLATPRVMHARSSTPTGLKASADSTRRSALASSRGPPPSAGAAAVRAASRGVYH